MNVSSVLRQRRFPRYACRYPITVIDHAKRNASYKGECRSLSRGGFGAVISGDLGIDRIVSIRFRAGFIGITISLEARVLYHDKELHGFEFVAPAEEQRDAIAALFREAVGASPEFLGEP